MPELDEITLQIVLSTGEATVLPEVTLADAGLRERDDLQRWVLTHPELVGPNLLLITSEFDRWELRERRVPDRLDVLFLDDSGALVVAELKRDRAVDSVDLQALKYAAYCSQLTVDAVVEELSRARTIGLEEARALVLTHAPVLDEGELAPIKIRLVAGSFGPAVTSVVLWLRDFEIDIGCIELTARRLNDDNVTLTARQLLPLPEAEDYFVRRRRRERQEEARRERTRGARSIEVLADAGLLESGTQLRLGLETLTVRQQEVVEPLVDAEPEVAHAAWTGEVVARCLKWAYDDEVYSATGLTKAVLELAGMEAAAIAGPDHWLLPDGRSMYRAALEVRGEGNGQLSPAEG